MTINNLKELQKVIQACRKLGVQAIKIDNVEFSLGPLPKATNKANIDLSAFPEAAIPVPAYNGQPEDTAPPQIQTEELTEEQLLFYSAQGHVDQVSQ